MKKTILAIALATSSAFAAAANFVSVDVDSVKAADGTTSRAQYVRAGKDVAGLNLGLQVRTGVIDGGGMLNSVEGTVGKNFGPVNVFGGLGHDNGFNGGASYNYGLVGASTGMKVGPVWTYAGVKTRINWNDANPNQTVAFVGASYPLTKTVSVNAGWSKSYQDIKENAWGVGVRVGF
jgi:hypothetical protein